MQSLAIERRLRCSDSESAESVRFGGEEIKPEVESADETFS